MHGDSVLVLFPCVQKLLCGSSLNNIEVREEDIDWTVYHAIATRKETTIDELDADLSLSYADIESSVERLEHSCLIGKREGKVVLLSIQEMMLVNRIRNAKDLPFTIEGGVIKVKQEHMEK